MLISPTEPARLKDIGTVSSLPERYGCDFLIVAGQNRLGVQRKQFPEDLLASLADGRLYEQLRLMHALDKALFIIEGHGQWTPEGELVGMRRFTFDQLIGLFSSIMFEFGVPVLWVRDVKHTIDALESIEHWLGKDKHDSLLRRPGPKSDAWGRITKEMIGAHLIQSFPGMGPTRALAWVRHFKGPGMQWKMDEDEMAKVPGIGKQTAHKMWEALDGEPDREGTQGDGRGGTGKAGKGGRAIRGARKVKPRSRQHKTVAKPARAAAKAPAKRATRTTGGASKSSGTRRTAKPAAASRARARRKPR